MSIKDFTDDQLKEQAIGCGSWLEFSTRLGYKSDSILRTSPHKERIRGLGINIKNKYSTHYKVSDEKIKELAPKCRSVTHLMVECGLAPHGYAHHRFKLRIAKLNIIFDISKQVPWNKGKTFSQSNDLQKYFENDGPIIASSDLRKKLIEAGLKKNQCEICKRKKWLGKQINLQLDHIDGDRGNRALKNLRILCPNCHTQTPTYGVLKHN